MKQISFPVDHELENIRIDRFLAEMMKEQSRSYIQKLIKEGLVTVNNHSIKSNYKIQSDDLIQIKEELAESGYIKKSKI